MIEWILGWMLLEDKEQHPEKYGVNDYDKEKNY